MLASHEPATDMLTVWSSTQTPHLGRRTLADLLERDLESIRMIAPDVGGGFGPKAPFYAEEAVIPAAAMKLGRPVKWFEDRREHFLCAIQERDQYWKVAVAVDADGKLLGVPRQHAARHRRVHAVGHRHALHRRGDGARALCDAGLPARRHGRAHQQGADRAGARRRPAAGGVHHGAADGPHRARAEARPRRGAPPQHDQARADAVRNPADLPRRQADRLSRRRFPEEPGHGGREVALRDVSRAPGRGAGAGALHRHRHRQLRRRHRPRSVRGRHRPRADQRQGRGRHRRHQPGPGHAHHAVADRRRSDRLPHRRHRR